MRRVQSRSTWARERCSRAEGGRETAAYMSCMEQVVRAGKSIKMRARLTIVPIDFRTAAQFVTTWHRHHRAPVGHKFSIGVASDDGVLRGVAMVGRPVARHLDNGTTLEVTRTATDGTPNANSALYGSAWRAAKALGYSRLITYTQEDESGSSLRGAGFRVVAELKSRSGWSVPSRPRTDHGTDHIPRTLWEAS